MKLDVNTDATIILTAKLEKLHKSAFPSSVRNTLNDAAFETKKIVPKTANNKFTIRNTKFIGNFTKFEKAKGFVVNQMVSAVGIDGSKPKGKKVADGLEKQETGGNIQGRKLIPHNMGRVSGSYGKKLKSKNQFEKIGKIGTRKERIKGSKYFRIDKGSKGTVFESKKGKIVPIYNYRKTKVSRVEARPFISTSAKFISKRMDQYYFKNAQFQFKKYLR